MDGTLPDRVIQGAGRGSDLVENFWNLLKRSFDFKPNQDNETQDLKDIKMQLSPKVSTMIRNVFPLGISTLAALAAAPIFLSNGAVSAKPIAFDGSYVGAGIAAGVTNGGQQGDAATFGGNIQGRVAIPNVPVSVRGAVLFTNVNSAVMPIVTYDVPIANNTNLYVGAGYSFVQKDGQPTPLGNKDAAVVTAGAETGIGKSIVVYGDAKVGIKAYQNSPASALSFQAGLGYRF